MKQTDNGDSAICIPYTGGNLELELRYAIRPNFGHKMDYNCTSWPQQHFRPGEVDNCITTQVLYISCKTKDSKLLCI